LHRNHPDICHDIDYFPEAPITAVGYLTASLARRRQLAQGGVTLLSCDNLPHNGQVLRTVIREFAATADPSLLPWIDAHVTFPCSMVDRIVPATTAEDLETLEQRLAYRDEAAVFTEPFSQWVIENNFARGAPPWQIAGALLTDDVAPFETMKLRLLNGSHSLLAYLGYLAGYEFVHEVMADENLGRLLRLYMDCQAQPTLRIPAGFDIQSYKYSLCQRFANAALNHRTSQIAQDGSQKIPQRWLATVRELSDRGEPTRLLAMAVAGWIRYLGGYRDSGQCFDIDDPLAEELCRAVNEAAPVDAVFAVAAVFGDLGQRYPEFLGEVKLQYRQLTERGVASTVAQFVENYSRSENEADLLSGC
jgi:fructuronate reductase